MNSRILSFEGKSPKLMHRCTNLPRPRLVSDTVSRKFAGGVVVALLLLGTGHVSLQAQNFSTYWTNIGSGKWEDATNWSAGAPFAGQIAYILNPGDKTVTIDGTTATNFPSSLTVYFVALNVSSYNDHNTLLLSNAGTNTPLHAGIMILDDGSRLTVSDSGLIVDSDIELGYRSGSTIFDVNSGAAVQIGDALLLSVGPGVPNSGTLNMTDGQLAIGNQLVLGQFQNNTGIVNMTGGAILMTNTNNLIYIGVQGLGEFTMSGGSVQAQTVWLGADQSAVSSGILSVNGGSFSASQALLIGTNGGTGSSAVTVSNSGVLSVTNGAHNAYIDVSSNGSLTLDGGTVLVDNLILSNGGKFTNSSGNLIYTGPFLVDNGANVTVTGGNLVASSSFVLGSVSGSLGTLNVTNGSLTVTNAPIQIGPAGIGQMTQSGGTVTAQSIQLGGVGTNGSGNLTLTGGHTIIQSNLTCNFVVVNGGDLDDGTAIIIGTNHDAAFQMISGTVRANINVGYTPGYTGTYTQSGGTVTASNFMIVGDGMCGPAGAQGLATVGGGGILYITNDTHTAVLDIRNGTFTLNPGATLVVDNLIMNTACGQFINNGGTLILNNRPSLNPNGDATGAGMPNGWKQSHGLDPLSNSGNNGAAGDPDGDGMNNLQEYLAGTDPQSAGSAFRTLSVVRTNGTDVRLDWTVVGGHGYVVQVATDINSQGSLNFTDLSPVITVGGTGGGQTNWVDSSGTGSAIRFYRVRLQQ
jgi:hypothetical protein